MIIFTDTELRKIIEMIDLHLAGMENAKKLSNEFDKFFEMPDEFKFRMENDLRIMESEKNDLKLLQQKCHDFLVARSIESLIKD